MDEFISKLSALAKQACIDFEARGGKLLNAGEPLAADVLAAPDGGLGPLLFMNSELLADVGLEFAQVTFARRADALAGYGLTSVTVRSEKSGGIEFVALAFSDFIRQEVVGPHVSDVDFAPLLANFRAWCDEQGPRPTLSPTIQDSPNPE
jgi:hypothetical protein